MTKLTLLTLKMFTGLVLRGRGGRNSLNGQIDGVKLGLGRCGMNGLRVAWSELSYSIFSMLGCSGLWWAVVGRGLNIPRSVAEKFALLSRNSRTRGVVAPMSHVSTHPLTSSA